MRPLFVYQHEALRFTVRSARAYYIGVDFVIWAKKHVRKPKKVSMD